jgi:threonine dehydratase
VDEIVTVDEAAVALAVLRLLEGEKMVVEGGGAAGLAAMLPGGPLDRLDLKVRAICVPSACHRSALGVPSECL